MKEVVIERKEHNKISVSDKDGGFITSQSVEANLLYEILNKLEDIRREIHLSAMDSLRK